MYTSVVPSLSRNLTKNSHQNLPVYPLFRDKAWHAVSNSQVSSNSHDFRKMAALPPKSLIHEKNIMLNILPLSSEIYQKANFFYRLA